MTAFADLSLTAFLDALASAEPTPGGGTASAVSGALGAALLMMVAGLPKSRTNSDAERVALAEARAALTSVRDRLLALADADAEAYNQVLAAYRAPKSNDEEKAARKTRIAHALRGATDTPLDTLRATAAATGHAAVVARCGNPSAASDLRVALELLEAAAAGAAANVEINLAGLDDPGYRKATAEAVLELTNQVTEASAAARAALAPPQGL